MKRLLLRISLFAVFCIILQANSCFTERLTGCDCEDEVTVTDSKTISSSNPSATVSTIDLTGVYEADAACHANMKLTFRWVSDDRAKTNERPGISYEFQTIFGYFPTNESMETISVDYQGNRIYTIKISEAADKSKPEGISYGVQLNYTAEPSEEDAVKCDVEITYRRYHEDAYVTGCTDKDKP